MAVRGESVRGFEVGLRRKDGAERIVRLSGSPMYQHGRLVGVAGIAEDITERRDIEQRLARVTRARAAMAACTQALVRAR